MEYVGSATTVLVNGGSTNEFNLGNGLSQGDPLLLFFFLLAVEGINVMLNSYLKAGLYTG